MDRPGTSPVGHQHHESPGRSTHTKPTCLRHVPNVKLCACTLFRSATLLSLLHVSLPLALRMQNEIYQLYRKTAVVFCGYLSATIICRGVDLKLLCTGAVLSRDPE